MRTIWEHRSVHIFAEAVPVVDLQKEVFSRRTKSVVFNGLDDNSAFISFSDGTNVFVASDRVQIDLESETANTTPLGRAARAALPLVTNPEHLRIVMQLRASDEERAAVSRFSLDLLSEDFVSQIAPGGHATTVGVMLNIHDGGDHQVVSISGVVMPEGERCIRVQVEQHMDVTTVRELRVRLSDEVLGKLSDRAMTTAENVIAWYKSTYAAK